MIRRLRPGALLPLLLATLAGCEPVTEPTPDPGLAPAVARQILDGGSSGSAGTVVDDEGNEYTVVEGRIPPLLPALHVSRLIDGSGGSLSLAGHVLTVPSGAVGAPTLFLMVVLPSGKVEVELRALVADLFGLLSVGERGFDRPVTLTLSYAWAANVDDPSALRILHLRGDGTAEPLASTVDPAGKTVTARLEHFSRYCMAIP